MTSHNLHNTDRIISINVLGRFNGVIYGAQIKRVDIPYIIRITIDPTIL